MSGRGNRKRGRPPKTHQDGAGRTTCNFLKKPKYLSRGSESQISTPSASRATSPEESEYSTSIRKFKPKNRGRGRKHVNTSIRNFSVRKGYESDYHYGSDFGDSSGKSDTENDILMTGSEDESIDAENDSESEFSICSFNQAVVGRPSRPPSPDPVWLQGREYPNLELPESSDDLLINKLLVLDALSIYEVLRRFRHLVRLSPFRFEDFCAALVCNEQSSLLVDVHIMLLKAILREEDAQGTHFGPLDQKDTINISLYLIDSITWPEVLRSYVESDDLFDRDVYNILCSGEYPYTGIKDRLDVLKFLTNQFLTTNTVRDVMLQEGPIHYDDHCRVCHRLGDLLCCETCPAVYHLECVDPPLNDVPTEDWQCNLCKSHKVAGVVDCILPQEKQGVLIRHDLLGLDRHGRSFWFIGRRIFVEDYTGENVWYYSTTTKFEHLISVIDKDDLESALFTQLNERREEIIRQLRITEHLTKEHKNTKKSYIELENENTTSVLKIAVNNDQITEYTQKHDIVTRNKVLQIPSGNLNFKLGMENGFKTYTNQYNTNPFALNKPQRNEERDKRRHLSHKFSLTTASEFKWVGITMGTLDNIVMTLRQTLINFEQAIAVPFMNPNWSSIQKLWNAAVQNSSKPFEFATVLLVFQASLKSVVFANVWHEHLGHISLQRITSADREERKKMEKREKKERDDEEERNRLAFNYIKYSLGLKHQIWKQKGEEYRVHGQWGWMWLSSSRRCAKLRRPPYKLAITPVKVNVYFSKEKLANNEVVTVDPRTEHLLLQNENYQKKGLNFKYLENFGDIKRIDFSKIEKDFGIVDVSKSLSTPGRPLYPKLAKKVMLDDLLSKRLQLKEVEEQITTSVDENKININAISKINKSARENFLEKRLIRLVEQQKVKNVASQTAIVNLDLVNSLARKIQSVRLQFSLLNRFAKQYRCYTRECNTNSNAVSQITQNTCYSPLCLQKAKVKKELLILLRKAHTAGNGSKETVAAILGAVKKPPSILETKLTEGRRDNILLEDTIELKWLEDSPIDLLQDWEQACSSAIRFSNDLLKECFIRKSENEHADSSNKLNKKIENHTKEQIIVGDREEYIENLDVCSNVEVESSESVVIEDSITNEFSEDNNFSKKNKKTQKLRTKAYFSTRDYPNQTVDRNEFQTKQNRRFPIQGRIIKRDDNPKEETEYFPNGKVRIYSANSTKGKIYLKDSSQLIKVTDTNSKDKILKFPLISNFLTHKMRKSLLILPWHELQKLARTGGKVPANGYHQLAKNNTSVWAYPCSRPLFKTCWSYRTSIATSLASIALQLRILWTCLRWDDMGSKAPSSDGKHQVTTDTEIITSELLKFKNFGRFDERTRYLRKKVVVPLEQPKTIREVTSIRSGLRKRKRAESPQPTEPQIFEEWVEEDKLELWEIKYIGDKYEKSKTISGNRSVSQRFNESSSSSLSVSPQRDLKITSKNNEDPKGRMEQQLKLQRAAQHEKKSLESKAFKCKGAITGNRRVIVKNPDGTTRIIHQTVTPTSPKLNLLPAAISPSNNTTSSIEGTDRNISESGYNSLDQKAIESQQQHKVQIIRGIDGKVSVRGLNPGQQLIQMPDGKLHVLTTTQGSSSKNKLLIKQGSQTATPVIKQIPVKQSSKSMSGPQKIASTISAVKQVAKVIPQGQKLLPFPNDSLTSSGIDTKAVHNPQNLQQLMGQSGNKVLVEQQVQGPKVLTSSAQPCSSAPLVAQTKATSAIECVQQYQQVANQLHASLNSPATQKIIQQIVNTSNVQQQIMVGGQRIVLNPGQTIVTQRSLSQMQQAMPSQAVSKSSQEAKILLQTNQVAQLQQQQQEQSQQQHQHSQHHTKVLKNLSQKPQTLHHIANSQQILVQNSTLAQQLAQGKLQVATINGQQVIIKPLGNNQAQIVAHIKTQSDGNAHIVTNTSFGDSSPNNPDDLIFQGQITQIQKQSRTVQQIQNSSKAHQEQPKVMNNFQEILQSASKSIEDNLLQGQPPGTVIKCVTAQVIQTEQGPRIVLQGLVGNDFTQQQLALVQQQVKQQLLKAQESSGKQSVLGPTKIYLAVQPPNININSQPPPLTPVNPSSQQQTKLPLENRKSVMPQERDIEGQRFPSQLTHHINFTENEDKPKAQNTSTQISNPGFPQSRLEKKSIDLQTSPSKIKIIDNSMKSKLSVFNSVSQEDVSLTNLSAFNQSRKQGLADEITLENKVFKQLNIITSPKKAHSDKSNNFFSTKKKKFRINLTNLQRHKDVLKKNILKKRSILERNLQQEVMTEMTGEVSPTAKESHYGRVVSSAINNKKSITNRNDIETSTKLTKYGTKKGIKRKEKVYCICRTPYDDTKFYVGCDLCSNWFHGDCVNITEEDSKKLSEFICKDCRRSRETQELYCSCRQPYDESQFYICCDKCQDWFHGHCVGIVQSEAEFIDEYVCPQCQRKQSEYIANTKNISEMENMEMC